MEGGRGRQREEETHADASVKTAYEDFATSTWHAYGGIINPSNGLSPVECTVRAIETILKTRVCSATHTHIHTHTHTHTEYSSICNLMKG